MKTQIKNQLLGMNPYRNTSSRLESFSDAVFAFAATLLIVSLEVPENFEVLKNHLKGFISFGISFFALALIWKTHVNYFNRTSKIDNLIIALNMAFLFVVLYFVYPLKFLINLWFGGTAMTPTDISELFMLYGAGFVLLFLVLTLMYYRSYKIEGPFTSKSELLLYTRHFAIFVLVGIISVILAKAQIGIRYGLPGFVFGIIGLLCWLNQQNFNKTSISETVSQL